MSDSNKKQMKTGIIGTVVAALCCFTPVLVILFGAVGLSAWLGWIDYVLFPALFASMGLVAHALYLRAGKVGPRPRGYILAGVVSRSLACPTSIVWMPPTPDPMTTPWR